MAEHGEGIGASRANHRWRFFRVGGFDQVRLDRGEDLAALDQLDQKLWLALSCPTRGLEFDARTLDLIDTDRDGRIRVPEILAAVQWACSVLRDPGDLMNGAAALPLSAIDDRSPRGKELLDSARHILANLGKADATAITAEDTADTARIFTQTKFNGDGVVPADSTDDEATRAVIHDIMDCVGAETDRSGTPGVSQAKVDQFFAEAQAYSDWWKKAENDPSVLPLGEATPAAAAAWNAVRAKVDDYFTRCRLAAFDPRATSALNRHESDYVELAAKDLSFAAEEVAAFPLSRIEADRPLALEEGLNPAWAPAIARLRADLVTPVLGPRRSLTAEEWAGLTAKLAAYEAWSAAKAGAAAEKLGLERVRQVLAGPSRKAITTLINVDAALEPQVRAITDVDRMVRYYRDLYSLLHNFVSFRDFYSRKTKAVFQAGTLYLDGRSCELCVKVEDTGRHAAFAGMSRCYLAYCDCVRRGGSDRMSIVAAFTGGDSDFLTVGRNGVFYDRKGQDWDATIVRIVENPISVRQAFWAPYKQVARFVEEQIEKFAVSRDKAAVDRMAAALVDAGKKPDEGKGAASQAFDIAKFAGIFAAIGLAMGALGTALAVVATGFLGLSPWQKPLAIAGALLVISGPSMLLASMKLRQRNLGPILEANGWAINARVRINIPFGRCLTGVAALPKGAGRSLVDPYAEKPSPWPKVIVVLVVIGLTLYYLNQQGKLWEWTGIGKKVEAQQEAKPAESPLVTPAPGGGGQLTR
jgi:hypothetical protein